ncbi:MAG: hypothetical protein QGI45_07965, partial [Myxococcota bacterium]|nr:hypothetical protein [Myxococcota bacterium]
MVFNQQNFTKTKLYGVLVLAGLIALLTFGLPEANNREPKCGADGDRETCSSRDDTARQDRGCHNNVPGHSGTCDEFWASNPLYTCGYLNASISSSSCTGCDCPDPIFGSCEWTKILDCSTGECAPWDSMDWVGNGECDNGSGNTFDLTCYGIDTTDGSWEGIALNYGNDGGDCGPPIACSPICETALSEFHSVNWGNASQVSSFMENHCPDNIEDCFEYFGDLIACELN